jgi:cytochrome o ubiquinol oxidase operon protein cyoD
MTLRNYQIGFALSIVLTLIAFYAVHLHDASGHSYPSHELLFPLLVILAVVQVLVQLYFFLHVRKGTNGWNLGALFFAFIVVCILIGGTLWIMTNLGHGLGTHTHEELPFDGPPSPQSER